MSYDASRVAFIDSETAGLNPDRHPVWELTVIVDEDGAGAGYVPHTWTQQMFGGRKEWRHWVDPWVLENTRIGTDYDPLRALTVKMSVDKFADLTRGRHLVGANPAFDSERMGRCWRAYHPSDPDIPWEYRMYDVEAMVAGRFGEEITGLRQCAERVGVPVINEVRHTSLGDALLAKAVFEAIMGKPA